MDVDNTDYDSDNANLPDGMKSLTPDEKSFLQLEIERVRADGEAVKAEFANAAKEDPINGVVDAARVKLAESMPAALEEIVNTAKFGSTESIRLNAAKYIADIVLGAKGSRGSDPKDVKFEEFMKGVFGESGEPTKLSSELPTANKNSVDREKGSDG